VFVPCAMPRTLTRSVRSPGVSAVITNTLLFSLMLTLSVCAPVSASDRCRRLPKMWLPFAILLVCPPAVRQFAQSETASDTYGLVNKSSGVKTNSPTTPGITSSIGSHAHVDVSRISLDSATTRRHIVVVTPTHSILVWLFTFVMDSCQLTAVLRL
jgi:hypothetical protein